MREKDSNIVRNLKIARENAGLTIEQAAKKMNSSVDLIERCENGRMIPVAVWLQQYADAYGVTYEWLETNHTPLVYKKRFFDWGSGYPSDYGDS